MFLQKRCSLKISQDSQGNTCVRVSILVKLQARGKKKLWRKFFPVNFAKFLGTLTFEMHLRKADSDSLQQIYDNIWSKPPLAAVLVVYEENFAVEKLF